MEYVKEKNYEKLAAYITWILKAVKGYAVKIVNPGGVENWTWGKNVNSLDDHVFHFEVTPREIIESLTKVNDWIAVFRQGYYKKQQDSILPIIMVGGKLDLNDKRSITFKESEEIVKSNKKMEREN